MATALAERRNLDETFEILRDIDDAVVRTTRGEQTVDDVLLLDQYGIRGKRFDEKVERLKGVAYRQEKAGNSVTFAAAEDRCFTADKALHETTVALTPKIEKLRAELAKHEGELRKLAAEKEQAGNALQAMQLSRDLLSDRLLPPVLKELLAVEQRSVHAKYKPLMVAAREKLSKASFVDPNDGGAFGRLQDAEANFKAVESRLQAELKTVGVEIQDFYFNVD